MDGALGLLFALGGAFAWALSSLLLAKTRSRPFALNVGKNCVAALAFTLTLGAIALASGRTFVSADSEVVVTLIASSVIGLVLGDTFHFRALRLLGPRRALVLETLAPVFAAGLAFVLQSERLPSRALLGIGVTLLGVVLVVGESQEAQRSLDARTRWIGSLYGVLAALGQAGGAMLSKRGIAALERLPGGSEHAALEASMLRLWTAFAIGGVVLALSRERRAEARELTEPSELRFLVPAALLATFVGVWFSLLAFQHTSVAVASTLLSLSPVLVLPLARVVLRERPSLRAIGGAFLSVAGTAVLFASS